MSNTCVTKPQQCVQVYNPKLLYKFKQHPKSCIFKYECETFLKDNLSRPHTPKR